MKTNNALDWANNLEESGMPSAQAREVAQIFHESHNMLMENMREMFAEQEKRLDARFENLGTKMDTRLESIEKTMATKADVKDDIGKLGHFTAILWLSVIALMVALSGAINQSIESMLSLIG